MAKIICDYCEFGTKDRWCYKGGFDICQGELFVCRKKAITIESNCNIHSVSCPLPTPEEMATVRLETEIKSNIALWADEDQVKYWKEVYSYGVEDERKRVGNCS